VERARSGSLRDVFGWSRPFAPGDVDAALLALLEQADAVTDADGLLQSRVRVSGLDGRLHVHSAAGSDPDAVFMGPDSYRFVRFLKGVTPAGFRGRALDIGTGAGAGALALAAAAPSAEVIGADVNLQALRYLAVNAAHSGLTVAGAAGPGLAAVSGDFDLIVANPPYVAGRGGRTYRDGGGAHGAELAFEWMRESAERLRPGGRIILYTGSPIVEGRDPVQAELVRLASEHGFALTYEEIDPDVFGGMLRQAAYAGVERIAAVGAVLQAPI
jgi:methylase of polypeptide subunit release factors